MEPSPNCVTTDFLEVTEVAGDKVSREQVARMCHRYYWAQDFCVGKDVLEVACGSGQGLGYLQRVANYVVGGDVSEALIARARQHYGDRVSLAQFDAHVLPYADQSFDVIILFEAIYYLHDVRRFLAECKRVLRPAGRLLIATANKDLVDFNPSPHSHSYLGTVEMGTILSSAGFSIECFGYMPTKVWSLRQRLLRPIKKLAVGAGLMPKSKSGKALIKRFVFGRLVDMPEEIKPAMATYEPPRPLAVGVADRSHKVLYCVATNMV